MERWEDTDEAYELYEQSPARYFKELIRRYPDRKSITLDEEVEEVQNPPLQLSPSTEISTPLVSKDPEE